MGIPRVRFERSWHVTGPSPELGDDLAMAILFFKMAPADAIPAPQRPGHATAQEFQGGSQRTMWLFGALLVSREVLPRTGRIRRTMQAAEGPVERIDLRLEDNIGIGLMDPVSAWRFRRAFREMADRVEGALRTNSEGVELASPTS